MLVLTIVIVVAAAVVVIVSFGLFYGVFTASKPVTTTAASVQNGDFQLQASVDKAEYRYGEPVTVNFKLTYLGKSPVTVNMPAGCPCVIAVKNATESWSIHYRNVIAYMSSYDFTPGQYIAGAAVITGGDIQYRSGGGGTEPMISDKPFSGFSPGGSYYIQVTTNYINATDPMIFGPEAELTTASLHITIKPR